MNRILIIEDDPAILKGLEISLRGEHYEVITATDGEKGYGMAKSRRVDLIILDIMLPGKNGYDICRDLRKDGFTSPILMLTSKKEVVDQVVGLKIGADDYMVKPFSQQVLVARIETLLRRQTAIKQEIETCNFDDISIDFKKMESTKNGKPLQLSVKEYEILRYVIEREGEPVTRDMLLTDVWGYGNVEAIPTTRTIDTHILSLRKKIEDDPANPRHLLTIPKKGYKFVR